MSPLPNAAHASWITFVFCASCIDTLRPHLPRRSAIGFEYDRPMRLSDVVAVSQAVAATTGRLEKVAQIAGLLTRTPPDEITIVVPFLSGEVRQGRIGIGGALLSAMRDVPPAAIASLDVADVDADFDRLAGLAGAGSATARAQQLRALLERATTDEHDFLIRLLFGELRQGAQESIVIDAVARASNIQVARVRRATMLAGDLAPVAHAALTEGEAGLSRFVL